jgi:hypothetical protein
MANAKKDASEFLDLPTWLWVILAPFIFFSIPFIVWGGFLIAAIAKAVGASEKTQQNAYAVAGVIVVPAFILLFVSSVSNSSSRPSRSYSTGTSSYYVGPKPAREPIGTDVPVRGYVRSDGTYVSPHFRTRANHTTSDNYSSYPNTNPYTSERGSQKSPSDAASEKRRSVYRPAVRSHAPRSTVAPTADTEALTSTRSRISSYDQRQREQKSQSLRRLGYEFPPDDYTWSQLYDFEQRIIKSRVISQLGVNLEWKKHSWSELYDIEQRILKSAQLADLGYVCEWQDHSWSEMYDIECRIRKANELRRLGYVVDWRKYDYLALCDLCWKARKLDSDRSK